FHAPVPHPFLRRQGWFEVNVAAPAGCAQAVLARHAPKPRPYPADSALSEAGSTMKIAYLVSEFPKASETFVSREVLTLANLGLTVQPFAFRAPSPPELARLDTATRCLVKRTHYVSLRSWPRALFCRWRGVRTLCAANARLQGAATLRS